MKTMKQINKMLITAFIAGIICTGIISCTKYNDWNVDESTNRLFRPTELTAAVDGVTTTLKWKAKPNTSSYTIELSQDSLQFSQIVKTYTTTGSKEGDFYTYTIPDLLDPNTQFSARIKGVDASGATAVSQWAAVAFKTKTEQIMYVVATADMTPSSVTLKWKSPNEVTHLMLGTTRYDISAAEKAAGEKTIVGLSPKTNYTAVLYNDARIRGQQTFRTPALIPTGPNVHVLGPNDNLGDSLVAATPGSIFVLLEGTIYNSDNTVVLPEGASFTIWGEEGAQKPLVSLSQLTLPANAGTIRFENVDLTGYPGGDQTKSKRNYIFNQSTASNTEEIIFENCTIRNFVNSPLRLQSSNPITINRVAVNKCDVYDIGDNGSNGTYAFIHTNVATGKINNISITNSTFSKIGYGLILHNAAPSQSVLIENNTFYNVIGNGRYLIDYNTQPVASSFVFGNTIFGKTLSPAGTARGIRAATAPIVNNSYKTTDAVIPATGTGSIPGIIEYNHTSTNLFTDPDNGNFLIKDNGFAGSSSAGDPRWRL